MRSRLPLVTLSLALACARATTGEPEPVVAEPVEPEPVVFVETDPVPPPKPTPEAKPISAGTATGNVEVDRARAKQLFVEGMQAYEQGDYPAAIAYFEQAHALAPMPELLFDIARCQQQLGDVPGACAGYESILAHPNADQKLRNNATDQRNKLGC